MGGGGICIVMKWGLKKFIVHFITYICMQEKSQIVIFSLFSLFTRVLICTLPGFPFFEILFTRHPVCTSVHPPCVFALCHSISSLSLPLLAFNSYPFIIIINILLISEKENFIIFFPFFEAPSFYQKLFCLQHIC